MIRWRSPSLLALTIVFAALGGCDGEARSVAEPAGPAPLRVNLDHLRHLGMDATVNEKPVRVVALYAEAPGYSPTPSPERDGSEGVAAVDDVARAAVVYLRAYEMTGDVHERDEALRLLAFVVAMEQ
jgi:hypothetical protein